MGSLTDKNDKVGKKFNGVFYVYRYSIIRGTSQNVKNQANERAGIVKPPSRIVKTKLQIFQSTDDDKTWLFTQCYKDRMDKIRKTTGVVMSLMGNVYCLGRIEDGFGIDILVFSEPLGPEGGIQEVTQALVMTLDPRNQPVVCRAVIKYSGENTEQIYGPYDIDAKEFAEDGIENFAEYMKNPSDPDRALNLHLR
jgi:hypothetical protein